MAMNVLYMNQGGGGQWGAIRYSDFDIILLAESAVVKMDFKLIWQSNVGPVMSIQGSDSAGRLITGVTDLDSTAKHVRPMATFMTRDGVRVVFVHLKSGDALAATSALEDAVVAVQKKQPTSGDQPTLWIGDFNRADSRALNPFRAQAVFQGGGQSWWDLDRAYVSGDWSRFTYSVVVPAVAGADHGHAAIAFSYR